MSDRIAVMKNGVFQQLDSPSVVYDRPKNAYVARFVGSANVLSGQAAYREGELWLRCCGALLPVSCFGPAPREGETITAAVRSEYLDFLGEGEQGIPAVVKEKNFAAGMLRIALETESGQELIASRHGIDYALSPGDRVHLGFQREHAVLVEAEDES